MNRIIKYVIVCAILSPIVLLPIPVIVLIIMDSGCPAGHTLIEITKDDIQKLNERRLSYLENLEKSENLTDEESKIIMTPSFGAYTLPPPFKNNTKEPDQIKSIMPKTDYDADTVIRMEEVLKTQQRELKRSAYGMSESTQQMVEYINDNKAYLLTNDKVQKYQLFRDGIKYFEKDERHSKKGWESGKYFEDITILNDEIRQKHYELYGNDDRHMEIFQYGDNYYQIGWIDC